MLSSMCEERETKVKDKVIFFKIKKETTTTNGNIKYVGLGHFVHFKIMEKGYLKENLPPLSNEPENRHRLTVSERGNYFVKFMKIRGASPSIIIFNSQKLNVVQMF